MGSNVQINTKAISSGSHDILVPTGGMVEENELQFQVSQPEFNLATTNLITAELKKTPDILKSLTNISICFQICNNDPSQQCLGVGGGNWFSFLDNVTCYVNGSKWWEVCDSKELRSMIKENYLTAYPNSIQRDHFHKSQFGQGLIDPVTGCFTNLCLDPAECKMIHQYMDKSFMKLGELKLGAVSSLKFEFRIDPTGSFIESLTPSAVAPNIVIKDFQVWGTVKKQHLAPVKTPFSSHTLAFPKFDYLVIPPSQITQLQAPNGKYTVNLTSNFRKINNIQTIRFYGVDSADPNNHNCRVEIACGDIELRINGVSNGCSSGEGNSVTAGKRGTRMHRDHATRKWYQSAYGVEHPVDPLTNQNKSWTLDGLVVTRNQGQNLPEGAILATGMNLGKDNIELEINNGGCVFNPTTSLYIEIMSLAFERLSASGIPTTVMT